MVVIFGAIYYVLWIQTTVMDGTRSDSIKYPGECSPLKTFLSSQCTLVDYCNTTF